MPKGNYYASLMMTQKVFLSYVIFNFSFGFETCLQKFPRQFIIFQKLLCRTATRLTLRKRCELEKGVFIVNLEHISHFFVVLLLLTLNE